MLRYAKTDDVFELGRNVFIVKNKKESFHLSRIYSVDYFIHHSEIQTRF